MSARVAIRAGGEADAAACGRIVADAATTSVYAPRLPHAARVFADAAPVALEGRARLVAEIDGAPVGFADYEPASGTIKYLFVAPARQGCGAGSALVDAVQRIVAKPVSVRVLAVNDVGVLWYLRRRFRIVDGWAELFEGVPTVWLRLDRPVLDE